MKPLNYNDTTIVGLKDELTNKVVRRVAYATGFLTDVVYFHFERTWDITTVLVDNVFGEMVGEPKFNKRRLSYFTWKVINLSEVPV